MIASMYETACDNASETTKIYAAYYTEDVYLVKFDQGIVLHSADHQPIGKLMYVDPVTGELVTNTCTDTFSAV